MKGIGKQRIKEKRRKVEEKSEICMMGIFRLSLVTDSCIYCSASSLLESSFIHWCL